MNKGREMNNCTGPIKFEYRNDIYIGFLFISRGTHVRIKINYGTLIFSIPNRIVIKYRKNQQSKILTLFSNSTNEEVDYSQLFKYYMDQLRISDFLHRKKIYLSGIEYLNDDHAYILGKLKHVKYGCNMAKIDEICARNFESLNRLYKDMALRYLTKRTSELGHIMKVPFDVDVGLSKANNYLGMNNTKLHRIIYYPALYAYEPNISDAIIIHELAHCFVNNHGKDFYAIIDKYCPRYKEYSSYISSGIFNLDMVHKND